MQSYLSGFQKMGNENINYMVQPVNLDRSVSFQSFLHLKVLVHSMFLFHGGSIVHLYHL